MEVKIGKLAGFCGGVKVAIEKTENTLETSKNEKDNKDKKVYCLGEVVHNRQVIEALEKKGLIIVNSIDEVPENSIMIIRAHGEAPGVYEIAKGKKIEIIDTTCVNVKNIHKKVKERIKDSFIIILGEKEHSEVIGTKGYAGENYYIVENEDDIFDAYLEFEKTSLHKVFVISQTTFSMKKFEEFKDKIDASFSEAKVIFDNTICAATELRQAECEKLSCEVDYMVVIGGKNSANTRKLVEISERNCKNTYFIQTVEDLKEKEFDSSKKCGIMAGASTPKEIIMEVYNILSCI